MRDIIRASGVIPSGNTNIRAGLGESGFNWTFADVDFETSKSSEAVLVAPFVRVFIVSKVP